MESLAESQKEAEGWLQANNSDIKLLSVDQSQSQLVFGCPDSDALTFTLTCPGPGEYWGVWSEVESMLVKLQDVIMHLDSRPNLTVSAVLDQVTKALSQQPDIASAVSSMPLAQEEEEESDEDTVNEEEDQEDLFDYYGEEDLDVSRDVEGAAKFSAEEESKMMDTFFRASEGQAKPSTVQRLVSDMKAVGKIGEKYGFSAHPDGDNLFKWVVKLVDIPADSQLGKDLQQYAEQTKQEAVIQMEMQFPWTYPFSPPFIRVVCPRFQFRTGHVTIGGSICMQMLTKSGWLPSNDIEGVLVQVRTEILSDPRASLDRKMWNVPYSLAEAQDAFSRMVLRYGWV